MPRQLRSAKPLIYVFCEGESEQAYTDYLKNVFCNVAVIKRPKSTGIFEEADSLYEKNKKYKNNAEITDEIWFFFDVEKTDIDKWDSRYKIIKKLRRLRKNKPIKIRLLMTKACIEYWLMLHYQMYAPQIETVADKDRIKADVVKKEPLYEKGDYDSTARIASNYSTAVINATKTVKNLLSQGLPGLEDTDERNQWLYKNCLTFSNVYEAIIFLESLKT